MIPLRYSFLVILRMLFPCKFNPTSRQRINKKVRRLPDIIPSSDTEFFQPEISKHFKSEVSIISPILQIRETGQRERSDSLKVTQAKGKAGNRICIPRVTVHGSIL